MGRTFLGYVPAFSFKFAGLKWRGFQTRETNQRLLAREAVNVSDFSHELGPKNATDAKIL